MNLQESIIEFKDENSKLLNRQIISLEESYSIIDNIVKDFLAKHLISFIDMEDIQNGYLGVLTLDDIFLDLKLLPNMYSLFNEIQKIYFEQRQKIFLFYYKQIQSFLISSSFDNKQSSGLIFNKVDKKGLYAQYEFLSQENILISKEQKFLDILVEYFLVSNSEKLFLREIYDWSLKSICNNKEKIIPFSGYQVENKGLSSCVLQNGNKELEFDTFLLPIMMEKIKKYEQNTGKKLYRVLEGGKMYE